MKKFIILNLLFFIGSQSFANEEIKITSTSERTVLSKEKKGIKAHKKGNYKKAYKDLYISAVWGRKDSQYFLAIMYLKGQYVKQDTIIGMGLLAVANEAKIQERIELYDTIYNSLSAAEKTQVDLKAEDYIAKFGIKAKGITCSEAHDLGSRKKVIDCHNNKSHVEGGFVID